MPGVDGLGVTFGLGVWRGTGVPLVPFVLFIVAGGREGLFARGVPFKTAAAPSRALAAPLMEKAGPKLAASSEL